MTVHREAFKSLLALERYCEDRKCEDCCFYLGDDHDNTGYCIFTDGICMGENIILDDHEELLKRVSFLEQLESDTE